MDATIHPEGSLEVLSQQEVAQLLNSGQGGLYELWRRCSLAVLNSGSQDDDTKEILRRNRDFSISLLQQDRGIKIALSNAPASAFVDGKMIKGIREQLFAALSLFRGINPGLYGLWVVLGGRRKRRREDRAKRRALPCGSLHL